MLNKKIYLQNIVTGDKWLTKKESMPKILRILFYYFAVVK